ncbi:MAG TPA: sigma-70 family RNA polymerase sigma factor [Flavobacterium sp.]|jgi:RNA polymerase sigma-70 factor (ECF subfamily)
MEFEVIYKIHWEKVFRLCMGYVNDRDLAKDIAQETFITVWQQLPKFRNESSVGTWVFRIASNHCLRQIERRDKMLKSPFPAEVEDKQLPEKETATAFLYKCISELDETDRLIISLELEDVRQAEIASIMGMSASAVRVRVHRIKDKLAIKFKKYGN